MALNQAELERVIHKAEDSCMESGGRLTVKRKNILMALLSSDMPQSAYEIADYYKEKFKESIPVMSVYRMLEFLINESLVHKLVSTNKYIACSHIACSHDHEVPQFLICDQCHHVREVRVKKDIMDALKSSVENTEFYLNSPELELHGTCKSCHQA
jgi:Fur family zinc uptake transcriptional regulator